MGATIESCYKALQMFQIVSQRYNIIEVNELAKSFYIMKLKKEAYYYYTFTSEMGYEIAQSNSGWMINRFEDILNSETDRFKISYRYHKYSSKQGNSNSQRIIGDYYYYLLP